MTKKGTNQKATSKKVASLAAKILKSSAAGKSVKKVSASAVGQTKSTSKTTSAKVAKVASSILRDGRTSKESKIVAGSVLSQKPKKPVKGTTTTGPRVKD